MRRKWKVKPFTKVKHSNKIYYREKEKKKAEELINDEFKDRILCLDFGTARIGVAASDPLHITAQGLDTIKVKSKAETFAEIKNLIEKYDVSEIVVGNPLTMTGKEGKKSASVKKFVSKLKERFSLPVILQDERLTSKEAEKIMREAGKKPSLEKENVNKVAAILILQSYLQSINY